MLTNHFCHLKYCKTELNITASANESLKSMRRYSNWQPDIDCDSHKTWNIFTVICRLILLWLMTALPKQAAASFWPHLLIGRVETSHWSRSLQILRSGWLGSKLWNCTTAIGLFVSWQQNSVGLHKTECYYPCFRPLRGFNFQRAADCRLGFSFYVRPNL